jgi:hypothetical protein
VTDIGLDGKEFTYYREVVIEMVRSENVTTAKVVADDLFDEYLSYLEEEIDPEEGLHRWVSAPKENSRIGIIIPSDRPGMDVLVTTSIGPISFRVVSYIPPWSDDFTTDAQLAIDFLNAQIFQLQEYTVEP